MAVGWTQLRDEALDLVDAARHAGVTLRVVGSTGIRLHCPAAEHAMGRLGRQAKDIDFVVPKEDRRGMRRCLEERGYLVDRDLLVAMEGTRYSFAHPQREIEIDVFVERLQFNHTIEVRSRLERHPTTLAAEDLLLAKLQIVKITPTDLLDVAVLFATHPLAAPDAAPDSLDADHIAALLANDWGFHHTAVANLLRLSDAVGVDLDLGSEANATVRERVTALLTVIGERPKSRRWRLRARVGERVQWWEDVNEREVTY